MHAGDCSLCGALPLNRDYSLKKNWKSFFEILESHSPSLPVPCEGTQAFWFCRCLLLRAFHSNTRNFTLGLDACKYSWAGAGGRGRQLVAEDKVGL